MLRSSSFVHLRAIGIYSAASSPVQCLVSASSFLVISSFSSWVSGLIHVTFFTFRDSSSVLVTSRHFSSLLFSLVTSVHSSPFSSLEHISIHRSIKNECREPLRCPCVVSSRLVTSRHCLQLLVTFLYWSCHFRHTSLLRQFRDKLSICLHRLVPDVMIDHKV